MEENREEDCDDEDAGYTGVDEEEEDQQTEVGAKVSKICRKINTTRNKKEKCYCCCRSHCRLSIHTMGVPRAYSFPKELSLVCDVKLVLVENTYE